MGGKVRRLTLTALVIVIPAVIASPQASASVVASGENSKATVLTDDHGPVNLNIGNGKHTKNDLRVFNTTIQRGLQNVSSTNMDGMTNIQSSSCRKRHRVCNIFQKQRPPTAGRPPSPR
ncbi:hypothetical protein [Sphaerisporangium perillae]|uniref:hypothetical protein n=1 Tax=Sphaerisporangium perillae TaxID=2935860 RepID=UPI00200BD07D|nr:hypothetical protein [Sphaerisporangium perillae]